MTLYAFLCLKPHTIQFMLERYVGLSEYCVKPKHRTVEHVVFRFRAYAEIGVQPWQLAPFLRRQHGHPRRRINGSHAFLAGHHFLRLAQHENRLSGHHKVADLLE